MNAKTPNLRRLAAVSLIGLLTGPISPRVFSQDATPPPASAEPATPAPAQMNSGEVVKMETFNVSTDIGAYHEETSSMATKVPTDLKDLSSSLQILNSNAITDRNATSLQDVFTYITGVTQSQQNINGFTFRGLPVSGGGEQNIEFDGLMGSTLKKGSQSAADVEDLEFLKGPNSVLYGQMHPGGLMNIVSKSPEEEQQINLRATYFTYAGAFNAPGNVNGGSFTLDATGPIDQGKHWLYRMIVDLEDTPPSRPGDFDKMLAIFPSLTYQWSHASALTVKLETAQDFHRQDDGVFPVFTSPAILTPVSTTKTAAWGSNAAYYFAPFNTVYQNTYDKFRDRGDAISALFHTTIGPWTVRIQTRSVWHFDQSHEDTDNSTNVFFPKASYATPGTTIERQYNFLNDGDRWNSFDANMFGTFGPEKFRNTIIVGAGGNTTQTTNDRVSFGPNVTPAITIIDPIINQPYTNGLPYPPDGTKGTNTQTWSTSMGEYISDQMRIFDRLHVTYGLRHDQFVLAGEDFLNPLTTPYQSEVTRDFTQQLGAVFDVTKTLSVYSSWSQSTTPNAVTDINAQGQSSFPAESGTQYESGIKVETLDHKLFASLCYFYIDRTNVLVATGVNLPVTGQSIFRLDGAQHSEGTEFESEWQPFPNWQVQIGAAWEKAFIAESITDPYSVGDDLANAPHASGTFWTRYNVPNGVLRGLGAGLGVIYVGKYWGGDPTTVTYFPISGYTRVDAAIYYKWRRYDLAINIQNVGDRRYIQSEQSAEYITPGEQRKITFSISTKL